MNLKISSVNKKNFPNEIMVGSVPECVTYSILEVNKAIFVDPHQVSRVEIKIALLENIVKSLPLSLFFILRVASKWGQVCNL